MADPQRESEAGQCRCCPIAGSHTAAGKADEGTSDAKSELAEQKTAEPLEDVGLDMSRQTEAPDASFRPIEKPSEILEDGLDDILDIPEFSQIIDERTDRTRDLAS